MVRPLLAGATHDTVACVLPAVADTEVGVPGTVKGIAAALAEENDP